MVFRFYTWTGVQRVALWLLSLFESALSLSLFVGLTITSARSTRLGADYSYEDSGSCVSGEEEGGIV